MNCPYLKIRVSAIICVSPNNFPNNKTRLCFHLKSFSQYSLNFYMGRPGFEPGTNRLKAEYSTVELATLSLHFATLPS